MAPFTVRVGDDRFDGPGVDLRDRAVDAARLLAAVRSSPPASPDLSVTCSDAGPLHGLVGHVGPDIDVDLPETLALAARSRGYSAPQAAALDAARDRLSTLDVTDAEADERRTARRRVAEAGAETDRLRERVATLRGRLQALRDRDDEAAEEATADLRSAARRLSEAETAHAAAVERLDQLSRAARRGYDRREERLALEDRVGNLEREVRRSLVAAVWDDFAVAVERVPGDGSAGEGPGEFVGSSSVAALGVVAVGRFEAPVVCSLRGFPSADVAVELLDAPVVLVDER